MKCNGSLPYFCMNSEDVLFEMILPSNVHFYKELANEGILRTEYLFVQNCGQLFSVETLRIT